jgi:hypothetical protein
MGVAIDGTSSWSATSPTTVVKEGYFTAPTGNAGRSYDISPDGKRFLLIKAPNAPPPQLVVVQHFDEELKRLLPVD